jgi:predicted nucleotidyltransferase
VNREIEKLLNTQAYDFLRTNPHLGENIVLLTLGGSKAYGTDIPTSDTDIRGIAIPTKKDILLGYDFENVVNTETDTTVYSFNKALNYLSQCNPNTIEILGMKKEDYFVLKPAGKLVVDNADIFLSQKAISTFGGYATSQLYKLRQKGMYAMSDDEYNEHIVKVLARMETDLKDQYGCDVQFYIKDGEIYAKGIVKDIPMKDFSTLMNIFNSTWKDYYKNSHRNDNAMTHAKLNKHAMHLVRLYLMGEELLSTGVVTTRRDKEHDLLMDIRNKKYMLSDNTPSKEFFELVEDCKAKFDYACKHTVLPKEPNREAIEELKIAVYESIVNGADIDYERNTDVKER